MKEACNRGVYESQGELKEEIEGGFRGKKQYTSWLSYHAVLTLEKTAKHGE